MAWIDYCLAAVVGFVIFWNAYLHQALDISNKRLSILTSLVVSGLTPQQLLAMQQFDIQIIERESKQK